MEISTRIYEVVQHKKMSPNKNNKTEKLQLLCNENHVFNQALNIRILDSRKIQIIIHDELSSKVSSKRGERAALLEDTPALRDLCYTSCKS